MAEDQVEAKVISREAESFAKIQALHLLSKLIRLFFGGGHKFLFH